MPGEPQLFPGPAASKEEVSETAPTPAIFRLPVQEILSKNHQAEASQAPN